ncbi:hypothetical protein BH09PSE1_BH09PSE1_04020 [soil metagenome]
MRKLAVATLALALVAPAVAFAQTTAPTTLSGLSVGNTMEVDYPGVPGHPHVTFKLKSDGAFTSVFPGGVEGSGDYVADAHYICWITKVPAEPATANGANARCEANTSAGKVLGESWTMTDSMGAEAVITITPGQ